MKGTQLKLQTNDLCAKAVIFPTNPQPRDFQTRGYRWNRSGRDVTNHVETIKVNNGDTLNFKDGWYYLKVKNGVVTCQDVTDGMIGVELDLGTNIEIREIHSRIQKVLMRLELYPHISINDNCLNL